MLDVRLSSMGFLAPSLQKMDARWSAVFDGVPLTPLDQLFWVSPCGSCVFP